MTAGGRKATITDYYRLTKPGIIRGNLLNTTAGFLFAAQFSIDLGLLLTTLLGTTLVIASACVVNNYIDRGIDKMMFRTESRALVTGAISTTHALLFAIILGLLGCGVLVFGTNSLVVAIGLLAVFMYVLVYGYFKRRSVHGTLIGSISGALPPAAGYVAVTGELDMGAWLLFVILVCWQMPHFYAIAMYRFKDYQAAGLPVLPVKKGMLAAKGQIVGYTCAFGLACLSLTLAGYTGMSFAAIMLATTGYWLAKELGGFGAKDDTAWARQMFLVSLKVIVILAIMLSFDSLFP